MQSPEDAVLFITQCLSFESKIVVRAPTDMFLGVFYFMIHYFFRTHVAFP
jgi:hypothetical protein